MEFREYFRIVRRWWWLLLSLPLLVAAVSFLTYKEPSVSYTYQLEYSVSFMPLAPEGTDQDPRLNAVQASEYVADDLTAILVGSEFMERVRGYLPEEQAGAASLTAARAAKMHRIITIDLSGPTEEGVSAVAGAVQQAVENDLQEMLDQLFGTGEARLNLIDAEGPTQEASGLSQLDIPLRVALALAAALVLAFALDYLDDSVRTREEAERLAPVLGEIPR